VNSDTTVEEIGTRMEKQHKMYSRYFASEFSPKIYGSLETFKGAISQIWVQ
jgi:hypothetical protein